MTFLLAAAQLLWAAALLLSTPRKYRLTLLYLCCAIPATLLFRTDAGWLRAWYSVMAAPVALLRVAAGLEILHRQTEGFRRWWHLTGCAFIVAGLFAGMGWVQSGRPEVFYQLIDFRRWIQIWLGGVYVYVEAFWITQGGGWWRRDDHMAALFGIVALNHGTVSFLGGALGWNEGSWATVQLWSWAIDTVAYLLMAIRCRVSPFSDRGLRWLSRYPFARSQAR